MNKQVITVIAVIAVAVAAVVGIIITTSEPAPAPTNLAVVNDVPIPFESFEARVDAYEREYARFFSEDERDARMATFKKATLDQIIDAEVARQLARSAGVSISSDEMDALMDDTRAAWGDDAAFRESLAAQGLTEESYRAELEYQTLLQRYAATLDIDVGATDEELRAIWEADRDRFPGEYARERDRILMSLELIERGRILQERIADARDKANVDILVPELADLFE